MLALVMHPIKILDAFNYFPSKTELLCRFHLCYVILMHLLAISQKERSSGYPCSRCLLGGTGNSHFYCSWPDMLHLLGNPPFLFLTPPLPPPTLPSSHLLLLIPLKARAVISRYTATSVFTRIISTLSLQRETLSIWA